MPATATHSIDAPPNAALALAPLLREMTSGAQLSDLLEMIAAEARLTTSAESVAIAFRVDGGEWLDIVAAAGEDPRTLAGMQIRAESSLAERVLRTGRTTVHFTGDSQAETVGARSACAAPIRHGGGTIGALFALNKACGEPFAGADVETIEAMAACAGLAVRLDEAARLAARKTSDAEALLTAARAIGDSLSLPDILSAALEALSRRLPHRAAAIYLLNDEHSHLFIAADRNLSADEREAQLAAESPAVARALSSSDAVVIDDIATQPEMEDLAALPRVRSVIAAPIPGREGPLGLLAISSLQPGAYSNEEAAVAMAVAAHAGMAIQNAFHYEEAIRRSQEASALHDHSQRMSESLDLGHVCEATAESVRDSLDADQAIVLLRQGASLVHAASRGLGEEEKRKLRFRIGQGVPGWVCQWLTPAAVADLEADSRNRLAPIPGVRSAIVVPIGAGFEALGVALATSRRRRLFTVAEMESLYTLANQAAVAIANARLYEEARSKSARMSRNFQQIARALGSASELKGDPNLLCDLAAEMLSADLCVVVRLAPGGASLYGAGGRRAASDHEEYLGEASAFPSDVARISKALVLSSIASDTRAAHIPFLSTSRMSSCVVLPLKQGLEVAGLVVVFSQAPRVFTKADLKLLRRFVKEAEMAERVSGA
jgi:GAF domain-containing protein